jgi:hypothetical protein
MEPRINNYCEVLELKKDKLTGNKVLDAYLDDEHNVISDSNLSAAEKWGHLSVINETLTVIMTKERRTALSRQIPEALEKMFI